MTWLGYGLIEETQNVRQSGLDSILEDEIFFSKEGDAEDQRDLPELSGYQASKGRIELKIQFPAFTFSTPLGILPT